MYVQCSHAHLHIDNVKKVNSELGRLSYQVCCHCCIILLCSVPKERVPIIMRNSTAGVLFSLLCVWSVMMIFFSARNYLFHLTPLNQSEQKTETEPEPEQELTSYDNSTSTTTAPTPVPTQAPTNAPAPVPTHKEPKQEQENTYDNSTSTTSSMRRRNIYLETFKNITNEIIDNQSLTSPNLLLSHINNANLDIPIPRNLNVLLMGDSLTRYQYLDLAYFLSHNGTWNNASATPNMVVEGGHVSWNGFYNFTNTAMQPYEQCDCFRQQSGFDINAIFENRYFYDAKNNNSVTYLQKFGTHPFHTSWNASHVHEVHGPMVQDASQLKPVFQAAWLDTIQQFVCNLTPKPSVFVFNSGLWAHNDFLNVTLQGEIIQALKGCDILSIYKTTTKKRNESDRNFTEYESQLCNQTDLCLDLTWTGLVPPSLYWDGPHFLPQVYPLLNLNLLSLLSSMDSIGI